MALLFCLVLAGAAAAADSAVYVIASALGERLQIVVPTAPTGTNFVRNRTDWYPLADPVFDNAVLDAAERVVRRSVGAGTEVLRAHVSGDLFDYGTGEIDQVALTRLLDGLSTNVANSKAAKLVLVAPMRADVRFLSTVGSSTAESHLGAGNAAGIGLYVDRITPTSKRESWDRVVGFLGAFSHLQLLLIDFKTRATLAKEIAVGTDWVSAASADDGHPWNALSQPAKVQMLRRLIARQVDEHLPPLIKAQ